MKLLDYLYKNISKSKNTIKNLLKNGNVYVNGKPNTKYDYELKENDKVEIKNKIDNIEIIYENKDIIVVNKPYNMLTISTIKKQDNTLYHKVLTYLKSMNKKNKIFIVHRLDKETSGLIVFAKSELIKNKLQTNWNKTTRKYIAIVNGVTKESDEIRTYLLEDNNKVFSSKHGKLAITKYQKIKDNGKYSMLDIEIKTGKKHQIRYQLNEINHPIVGDKKYGKTEYKRMLLHAYKLSFKLNGKNYNFKANIPYEFEKKLNNGQ